ncbi:MAG: TM2 domain-containing protein [Clostridia bacterium]|nr:TM2 domain-containing protein [Clostridia bacterium]
MFCKYCGAKLDDTAKFCSSCGAATDATPASSTPPSSTVPPAYGASTPGYIPTPAPAPVVKKSKIAAALLAFFLGGFGVHNFYLGYTGKGIAQLLITILSCGILSVISSIWSFVEFILILIGSINDAKGIPLE